MKSVFTKILGVLLFVPAMSYAANFQFSYLFQSGYGDNRGIEPTKVTGTFVGVEDGLFVRNVSDIKINIQGREFSPNLVSALYAPVNGNPWDFTNEGLVSFDAMKNNFVFVDADYAVNGTYTNYLLFTNDQNTTLLRQATNDNGGYSYGFDDDSWTNDSWKLVSVAEPGSLVLLMIGVLMIRLRRTF